MEVRRHIGVDRIMWSTDFPHIVTRWPESRKLVDEQFVGVPEQERHAILAGNAVKFFHLDGNYDCRTSGAHGPAGQVSPLFRRYDWVNT